MAYFAPYIDETGFHVPTYSDIRDDLIASAKAIYGADIYLGNDSMDYQYISAIAAKHNDAFQAAQLVYNSRSPVTSVGAGLDTVVKVNGLSRKVATKSTAIVTITGTSGTTITSGVLKDTAGLLWDLPSLVTIPAAGTIDVTATAQIAGATQAQPGVISIISTPTYGWSSATNAVAATIGTDVETDAQMRSRQAVSTAVPSLTVLEGMLGAVLGVDGVTRAVPYENKDTVADANGIPPHSTSFVVEGGADQDIADQIYTHKTPGSGTYGTTTVNVNSVYGYVTPINFYRPTAVQIDVHVSVKALTGYSTSITDSVKADIVDYLNSLQIGDDVINSSLWGAALEAQPDIKSPAYSITAVTACVHGGSPSASDIVIAFNEAASGVLANMTVTVT